MPVYLVCRSFAELFREPEPRAPGPRVTFHFVPSRIQFARFADDGFASAHTGHVRRADAAAVQLRQFLFDDAVFQRLEGDDADAAARFEDRDRILHHLVQDVQLVVDFNTESLESTLRGMRTVFPGSLRNGLLDDRDQFPRGFYRMLFPLRHDELGDPFRPPFLAVAPDDAVHGVEKVLLLAELSEIRVVGATAGSENDEETDLWEQIADGTSIEEDMEMADSIADLLDKIEKTFCGLQARQKPIVSDMITAKILPLL